MLLSSTWRRIAFTPTWKSAISYGVAIRYLSSMNEITLDIREVYCLPKERIFVKYVKAWQSINKTLKQGGISAPSDISFNNVMKLYEDLDKPIDSIPCIHVGGTNGKGSTSWKLSKSLQALGIRTGLFVSPHIVTCRERMQINGELIEEEDFMSYMQQIFQLCIKHHIYATEFEVAFLMSTLYFQEKSCDAIVLEVGMGGEYDATNVVKTAASVICSIGLDHVQALGNTIELITQKKVGIFKSNCPALIGPNVPLHIAQDKALHTHTPLYSYTQAWEEFHDILQAHGLRQQYEDTDELNTALSVMVLGILQKHYPLMLPCILLSTPYLHEPLCSRPPCRWEKHTIFLKNEDPFPLQVILDMGHNPPAIEALVHRIQQEYSPIHETIHIVFGMSRDKDVRTCLRLVSTIIPPSHIHFAQSSYYRALSTEKLQQMYYEETGTSVLLLHANSANASIRETIEFAGKVCSEEAQAKEQSRGGILIICGTGYIMSDARAYVGIVEPRDDIHLTALHE